MVLSLTAMLGKARRNKKRLKAREKARTKEKARVRETAKVEERKERMMALTTKRIAW